MPDQDQGKTIGDVLDGILANPRRWGALFGLLVSLCGLALLVMFVFTRLFSVSAREVSLGGSDSHILFQAIDSKAGTEETVALVTPQGWQKISIHVRPGDKVSFTADGKICIDINEVVNVVHLRQQYEDEIAKAQGIRQGDPTESRVPEDFFTEKQKKTLILNRPWVGPEGFDLALFEPSFRSRRKRYLMPEQNAGSLVAAIHEEETQPQRGEVFEVGRARGDFAPSNSGWIWFTVNDVQDSDPENPNLFYNDNLGVFWVHIVVKRG